MLRTRLLLVLLLTLLPTRVFAGPLQDIEDSGRHGDSSSSGDGSASSSSSDDDEDDEDDDDESDSFLARFFGLVFLSPWLVPRAIAHDPCIDRFAAYPYADGRGHLRIEPTTEGCAPATTLPPARIWAMQTAVEGTFALAGVGGGTLDARLQLPVIELSGRLSLLTDYTEHPHDQALLGTAHLSYRFAQTSHVDLRTGIGMRGYGLHHALYGFDALYGIDIFGKRPMTGHVEFHLGSLGQAGTGQVRATIGGMLRQFEIYAGWDHTSIWTNNRTTRLSGPLLGVRAWF